MNAKRRALLHRKSHRPLVSALAKILSRPKFAILDMEMSWPPDDDGLYFCAQADNVDVNWDFVIPTAHWLLPTDSDDEVPEDLDAEIKHLFRAAWKEARSRSPAARGYLRFHDSSWSIELSTGREVWDRDRSDFVEPERKAFSKTGRSTKQKAARNGELVRRGDPLAAVKKAYQTTEEPDPGSSQYHWPQRGVRIKISKGKVEFLAYFHPFPDCICGIWIGAHAWEVEQILGRAKDESSYATGRLWRYDVDGFMSVGFDRQDRVSSIVR